MGGEIIGTMNLWNFSYNFRTESSSWRKANLTKPERSRFHNSAELMSYLRRVGWTKSALIYIRPSKGEKKPWNIAHPVDYVANSKIITITSTNCQLKTALTHVRSHIPISISSTNQQAKYIKAKREREKKKKKKYYYNIIARVCIYHWNNRFVNSCQIDTVEKMREIQ